MNKNSRIYIAGHRGLVGSALVRRLQAQVEGKENGKIEFRGAAKTGGYYYLDTDR